ncbi:MAG TPA: helix-turn-helix transcriptional regulator [Terriglobales bacterium]|jgi:PadR family transcriptional regulator PadR|nr:helix-turn-helix transcriptional regulator [Terriglobales bacterium]
MTIQSKIARGSAELAVLALLEERSLYGFEIAKQIEERTGGSLRFTMASLYPMLYELEKRGSVKAQWEANPAGRDRRYYSLTGKGRKELEPLRREWKAFFVALDQLTGFNHA